MTENWQSLFTQKLKLENTSHSLKKFQVVYTEPGHSLHFALIKFLISGFINKAQPTNYTTHLRDQINTSRKTDGQIDRPPSQAVYVLCAFLPLVYLQVEKQMSFILSLALHLTEEKV